MTNHLMGGHDSPTALTLDAQIGQSVEHFLPVRSIEQSLHSEKLSPCTSSNRTQRRSYIIASGKSRYVGLDTWFSNVSRFRSSTPAFESENSRSQPPGSTHHQAPYGTSLAVPTLNIGGRHKPGSSWNVGPPFPALTGPISGCSDRNRNTGQLVNSNAAQIQKGILSFQE
jgi:hypothetical protein